MRILLANTYHYYRGGASAYTLSLAELLKAHGHEVFHFAMQHPESLPCPETQQYWPDYIEYPELLQNKSPANIRRVLKRTIHSKEALEGIRSLIHDKGPFDIIHLNNILHHLTPSILYPLEQAQIPIVWTLHDYSLICPNTNFVNDRTGELCKKCQNGGLSLLNAPLNRCKKGSFAASLIAAYEAWIHRIRKVTDKVDLFISPSQFLVDKFTEAGFDRNRFRVLPNFVNIRENKNRKPSGYALYAGRLTPEKGVELLIKVWREIPAKFTLKIAGSGPIENQVKEAEAKTPNIEFLGFVAPDELRNIRLGADFVVVPSICWDNFPYSVLESLADGVPVIGSEIGGIPEMIENDRNGLLFAPGNPVDLRDKIMMLFKDSKKTDHLGKVARELAEKRYSAEIHIEKLMSIYARLTGI